MASNNSLQSGGASSSSNSLYLGASSISSHLVTTSSSVSSGKVSSVQKLFASSQGFSASSVSCPNMSQSSSSQVNSKKRRPWSSPFKLSSSVSGFAEVNVDTFHLLRSKLSEEEDTLCENCSKGCTPWSLAPLLHAQVDDANSRVESVISGIKVKFAQQNAKLKELGRELQYRQRVFQKLYNMSSSAKRPGGNGKPAQGAIKKGLSKAVKISELVELPSPSEIFISLNLELAVQDAATGATLDQFGKYRNQEVALPALKPVEPRADAMPHGCIEENMLLLDQYVAEKLRSVTDPIEVMAKQYVAHVTIHPCVDANGRSALLAIFPLANKFELPWPLVTENGSKVFHCQNQQAESGKTIHPVDAMAYIIEGMYLNLELQRVIIDGETIVCQAEGCSQPAWVKTSCRTCKDSKAWCEEHVPAISCVSCKEITLAKEYL